MGCYRHGGRGLGLRPTLAEKVVPRSVFVLIPKLFVIIKYRKNEIIKHLVFNEEPPCCTSMLDENIFTQLHDLDHAHCNSVVSECSWPKALSEAFLNDLEIVG